MNIEKSLENWMLSSLQAFNMGLFVFGVFFLIKKVFKSFELLK